MSDGADSAQTPAFAPCPGWPQLFCFTPSLFHPAPWNQSSKVSITRAVSSWVFIDLFLRVSLPGDFTQMVFFKHVKWFPSERIRGHGLKLWQGKFRLDITKRLFPWKSGQELEWVAQGGGGVASSGSVQEVSEWGTWGCGSGVILVVLSW